MFATRVRHTTVGPEAGAELSDELRVALPPRFEAVGEALASGTGPVDACTVVGRDLALDGISLEEALDGLRTTYRLLRRTEPDYSASEALCVAWSESMLGYLHQLSCEDPLTGLSSLAHVRSRLSDLYRTQGRGGDGVRETHALVVVDRPPSRSLAGPGLPHADALTHALDASRIGDTARTVFPGTETIGRFGLGRIVVIADRDPRLGRRVSLLRRMLHDLGDSGPAARVWIEGLPDSDRAAASLLDELARL